MEGLYASDSKRTYRNNKEASLQLHYAFTLGQVGELCCVKPDESFDIKLETHHAGKNIDVWCRLGEYEAAIEMKCFRKKSNRATDTDMYDVLKDISRLESYSHVRFRRFICLTDDAFYSDKSHSGHAGSVSIADGQFYQKGSPIVSSWVGQWKDKSRDKPIVLKNDLRFDWHRIDQWRFLYISV
jgi:hypothetical protein